MPNETCNLPIVTYYTPVELVGNCRLHLGVVHMAAKEIERTFYQSNKNKEFTIQKRIYN